MQQLSIRLGDTLYATCQLTDSNGSPVLLDDVTITAQLIDRSCVVVHTFGITIEDSAAGSYFIDKFDTSTLSAQKYTLQISYNQCGSIVSAVAIELNVSKRLVNEPVIFAQVAALIGNTAIRLAIPPCEIIVESTFIPLGSTSLITSDGQLFLVSEPLVSGILAPLGSSSLITSDNEIFTV